LLHSFVFVVTTAATTASTSPPSVGAASGASAPAGAPSNTSAPAGAPSHSTTEANQGSEADPLPPGCVSIVVFDFLSCYLHLLVLLLVVST